MSEVEQRPMLVTGGYSRHSQWVKVIGSVLLLLLDGMPLYGCLPYSPPIILSGFPTNSQEHMDTLEWR